VLGDLVKRAVNVAVVLVAAVTFFLVPVGRKTLLQHLVAIFTTPPARECAAACTDVARRVVERATAEIAAYEEARKRSAGSPGSLEKPVQDEEELLPAD